jgi:hypothetical protein
VAQPLAIEGKTLTVRAYENIVYVARPADTVYQKLNVYVPGQYFTGHLQEWNGINQPNAAIAVAANLVDKKIIGISR